MNVSKNQFYIFLICVAIGVLFGIIFMLGSLFDKKIKIKKIIAIKDIFLFIIGVLLFVFISFYYNFPSIRAYMIIGFFVGFILHNKSLGIFLAKLIKKIYNIKKKKTKEDAHD